MDSFQFLAAIVVIGLFTAVSIIWALIKFVPDEMDREHDDRR